MGLSGESKLGVQTRNHRIYLGASRVLVVEHADTWELPKVRGPVLGSS